MAEVQEADAKTLAVVRLAKLRVAKAKLRVAEARFRKLEAKLRKREAKRREVEATRNLRGKKTNQCLQEQE